MSNLKKNFSTNLKTILARKGVETKAFARLSELSLANAYRVLSGDVWPGADTIENIMQGLDVTIADLYGESKAWDTPTLLEAAKVIMAHAEKPIQKSVRLPSWLTDDPDILHFLNICDEAERETVLSVIRSFLTSGSALDSPPIGEEEPEALSNRKRLRG